MLSGVEAVRDYWVGDEVLWSVSSEFSYEEFGRVRTLIKADFSTLTPLIPFTATISAVFVALVCCCRMTVYFVWRDELARLLHLNDSYQTTALSDDRQ